MAPVLVISHRDDTRSLIGIYECTRNWYDLAWPFWGEKEGYGAWKRGMNGLLVEMLITYKSVRSNEFKAVNLSQGRQGYIPIYQYIEKKTNHSKIGWSLEFKLQQYKDGLAWLVDWSPG